MSFKQYDINDVIVIVAGIPCAGLESVLVEFESDKRSKHMSVDGSGRFVSNKKKDGSITIELVDYSPTNVAFLLVDKTDVPVLITVIDKSNIGSGFVSDSCKLRKVPSLSRGEEGGTNEWVFDFLSGVITHGSAKE